MNQLIKPNEMQLGDVVRMQSMQSITDYNTCTVVKIEDGLVEFLRPFVYGIGCAEENKLTASAERFSIFQDSNQNDWILLNRG